MFTRAGAVKECVSEAGPQPQAKALALSLALARPYQPTQIPLVEIAQHAAVLEWHLVWRHAPCVGLLVVDHVRHEAGHVCVPPPFRCVRKQAAVKSRSPYEHPRYTDTHKDSDRMPWWCLRAAAAAIERGSNRAATRSRA